MLRNVSGCGSIPPKRDGTRPAAIRCRESVVLSRREQVAGLWNSLLVERQQPLFGFGMRLDCAVMEDVGDGDVALGETARHQETAMTIQRFALGAHQTNARPRRDSKQPIQAGNIFGLDRHGLVIGRAIAIERVAARPAAAIAM